ncbi:hypothetical protein [Aureimonas phyllosphaerae]|uniref:Uncharacterized protein n=1 Tax=Aureimonas phyllosphaerae TaxID=1166078 RepID=A0A7W6C0S4_9HYPH|nr:hypothetical protein [Aureimonas phyllosphaerae]MBB3937301.1 hypothetical protein [Aureimonas phyllosphaerae]MBB3961308.1 hypothetical protein [Aureimonas phyllosphaerae]SFF41689.1 hypothetical protein SAMN05216566_11222 [Aureimonas phyllosphaerae]
MPEKLLFIVQQFERMGKRLVAGRLMEFKTATEAQRRAERDVARTAGVVALQQTVDTDTGESSRARSCWSVTVNCLPSSTMASGGFRPTVTDRNASAFAPNVPFV